MGFQRNLAMMKILTKVMQISKKAENYYKTRIIYFLDDLPLPLPLPFLKGGMSGQRICSGIKFAGEDFDTL